jgi:hypothetical protein
MHSTQTAYLRVRRSLTRYIVGSPEANILDLEYWPHTDLKIEYL